MFKSIIPITLILVLSSCACSKHWQTFNPQTTDPLHDIEVLDKNTAFTYSYGTGKFLSTKNGRKTWQLLHQFDSIYFEQMQFFDSQNGWLAGNNKQLLKTNDGGKTWLNKSLKEWGELDAIYGMVFIDDTTGWIAVLHQSSNGLVSKIYQTNDGGDNWKHHSTLNEMILNLEYHNNTLWASGNNVILKLDDVATEWQTFYKDEDKKTGQIRDLEFIGKNKLIAASFTSTIVNCNKGNCINQKIGKSRLRSISIGKNGKGIAVGDAIYDQYNFFTTNNRGKTWQKAGKELPDIHRIFKHGKYYWIAGKEGFIAKFKHP